MDITHKKKGIYPEDLIIISEKYSFKLSTSKTERIAKRNWQEHTYKW